MNSQYTLSISYILYLQGHLDCQENLEDPEEVRKMTYLVGRDNER